MADDTTVIIPPIRTSLADVYNAAAKGVDPPNTAKSWYLYWQNTGDQVNFTTQKVAKLVTWGTAGDRPDPSTMPDGALYAETDRSGVIYQNQGGVWVYLTGTMWGTLNPDARPTDLGPVDSGFDFRATDQPAQEFIWNGGQWVEVTPNRFGVHADRIALNVAYVAEGTIWVETDRSQVIYQLEDAGGPTPAQAWVYCAGTMWGTLSPDQRPTDLGPLDSGFVFRTQDQPPREFIWNGGQWVEVTPGGISLQSTPSSGALTLTAGFTQVPGLTLTLARTGDYLVTATIFFTLSGAGDNGAQLAAQLVVGSTFTGWYALFEAPAAVASATVSQEWRITVTTAPTVISIYGAKSQGTGTSQIGNQCALSALWISS